MSTINIKSAFANLAQLAKVPGNKAAMVRLGLVALTLIVGTLLTICALPHVTGGFGQILISLLTGIVSSITVAAFIWGFAKWAVFIFPKSLALANRFWNSLYALGIFALAIKAMTWIWLLLMPVTLFGLITSPLMLLVSALSMIRPEFLGVLILTILVVATLFFVVLLDVCKLQNLCWKQTLKDIFAQVKLSCISGWQKLTVLGKQG